MKSIYKILIYIAIVFGFWLITNDGSETLLLIPILFCYYKINKFINTKDY